MLQLELKLENWPAEKGGAFDRAVIKAMKQAVRLWHKNIAPLHFKRGAARKYGYKPRTRRYQNLKNRVGAGPLVGVSRRKPFGPSGRSKRQLLQTIKPVKQGGIVAGKFVTSPSVRYFWQTPPGHPKKGEELVKLTKTEERALSRQIQTLTQIALDESRTKKKVS